MGHAVMFSFIHLELLCLVKATALILRFGTHVKFVKGQDGIETHSKFGMIKNNDPSLKQLFQGMN